MKQCSVIGCPLPAVWTRKPGWMVAPGSPVGDVCEDHHCWERITPSPAPEIEDMPWKRRGYPRVLPDPQWENEGGAIEYPASPS